MRVAILKKYLGGIWEDKGIFKKELENTGVKKNTTANQLALEITNTNYKFLTMGYL